MSVEKLAPESGFDSMKEALQKWEGEKSSNTKGKNKMENERSLFSLRNLVIVGTAVAVALIGMAVFSFRQMTAARAQPPAAAG